MPGHDDHRWPRLILSRMDESPERARRPGFVSAIGVNVQIRSTWDWVFLSKGVDKGVVVVTPPFVPIGVDVELLPEFFLLLNGKARRREDEAVVEFAS